MITSIDIRDVLIYFGDFSILRTKLILIIICTCILGCYMFWRENNYWERLSLSTKRNSKWLFVFICMYSVWLLFDVLGDISNTNGSITVHGELAGEVDLELDCSEENFSCCPYYDNCQEGINDRIDYNTYITTVLKDTGCLSSNGIIYERDRLLGFDQDICGDSIYGC